MGTFTVNFFQKYTNITIVFLSLIILPLGIGSTHLFDWDEVNFAEIAREMLVSENYTTVQINFLPFWEKPPLFFWIQALSMKIFGVTEFASRFPNAIVGVGSLLVVYNFGKKIESHKLGVLWALAYAGSVLPFFYFKTGIIDPLFNLFIYVSLLFFYEYLNSFKIKFIILTAFFTGLALLTKGPVAIIIVGLTAAIFVTCRWALFKFYWSHLLVSIIIVLAMWSIWFLPEIISGGGLALFQEFIAYQIRLFSTSEAGHGQPFYYHFIVLFFGCFPISLIAFPYLLSSKFLKTSPFFVLNFILFWVVLILFSLTTTKIVHYSSMCYFPLSFIAAYVINYSIDFNENLKKLTIYLLYFVSIVLGLVFTAVPLIVINKNKIIPFIKDEFVVANLQMPVQWNGFEPFFGILFMFSSIYFITKLKNQSRYFGYLIASNIVVLTGLMCFIVPKVEQHVQGSMIGFFESHKNQYVLTYGFRSYAQYFYTSKEMPSNKNSLREQWLLSDQLDQNLFIVCKKNNFDEVKKLQNTTFLYTKGGFYFFRKTPKNI